MARVPLTEGQVAGNSVVLNVKNIALSQEKFLQLCRDNRDLRMELSAQKELIVMTPPGGRTSRRNIIITTELTIWSRKDGKGLSFESNCLFVLPNGANRAPDAAWVRRDRWDTLTSDQQESAVPLCPDFVVELMSRTDRLKTVMKKMDEYMANGARLGWLLDPYGKQVYIYQEGRPIQHLKNPQSISGDPILPGFVLDLAEIFGS